MYEAMHKAATLPLFFGSRLSNLAATLLILNYVSHRSSSVFVNELFHLFHKSILSSANSLPGLEYQASRQIAKVGASISVL